MSATEPLSVVFAGFRETGKTTFLVALWHTVINNEVSGALSLENFYEGDREYITSRHNEWLAYEPVKRTLVDHATPIRMTLREAAEGKRLHLGIPDLSGETFKVQFEERRASPGLVSAIGSATGVALFINPLNVADPTCIRDAWAALDGTGSETTTPSASGGESEQTSELDTSASESVEQEPGGDPDSPLVEGKSSGSETAADFDAAQSCTQVKYVDLLQQLLEHGPAAPLRCAVIVSAMDVLDGTEFEDRPEDFVRTRMSLLDQYLRANTDLFQARIYGVSAQGGQYSAASIESLAKLGARRIRVSTDGQRSNDITKPLRWLSFGEE